MRIGGYSILLAGILGCSPQTETSPRIPAKHATLKEEIVIKSFVTGQKASKELKAAKEKPFQWTYFGRPRIVEYEALKDGTVTLIKFDLEDSWEGYNLKSELEGKFKTQGTPDFQFRCESQDATVEFTDKRSHVTDESCSADDGRQTLVVNRRWPKYEEPLIRQFPTLKFLLDRGSVTLYDAALQKQKKAEVDAGLSERVTQDAVRAAKDM
jgi:hypothetical protein